MLGSWKISKLWHWPTLILDVLYHRPLVTKSLILLILLSLFITGLRIARDKTTTIIPGLNSYSSSDFDDYYRASLAFARGDADPYRTRNMARAARLLQEAGSDPVKLMQALAQLRGVGSYLYPPFTAFLLTPLGQVGYVTAAVIFQIVSIAALGLMLFGFQRTVADNPAQSARVQLAILGGLVILYVFLAGNMANGNIGFILILLCGGGIIMSFSAGPILRLLGGLLIGLAIVMKVTPLFLVVLLVSGRRYLALAGLVAGVGLALLIPGLYYGHDQNLRYLSDWYLLVIQSFNKITFVRSWMNNQSVAGMIGRFFLAGQEVKQSMWGLPLMTFGGLTEELRVGYFGYLVKGLNLLLVGLCVINALLMALRQGWRSIFHFRIRQTGSAIDLLLDSSLLRMYLLTSLVLLVCSGVSWYHAYSFLLPVVVLYLYKSNDYSRQTSVRLLRIESSILSLLGFFGFLYQFFPSLLKDFLSMYSVFTIGIYGMALWLGLTMLATWLRQRIASGADYAI